MDLQRHAGNKNKGDEACSNNAPPKPSTTSIPTLLTLASNNPEGSAYPGIPGTSLGIREARPGIRLCRTPSETDSDYNVSGVSLVGIVVKTAFHLLFLNLLLPIKLLFIIFHNFSKLIVSSKISIRISIKNLRKYLYIDHNLNITFLSQLSI